MAEIGKAVTVGSLFVLFLGVVVVLSLFPEIASSQHQLTNKLPYVNDNDVLTDCYAPGINGTVNTSNSNCNKTLTQYQTDWRVTGCPLSSLVITNASGTLLILDTDYSVDLTYGIVSYKNTSKTSLKGLGSTLNMTNASYDFCTSGYITDSAGRSVAGLIGIFTALALVAFAIYYGVKQYF